MKTQRTYIDFLGTVAAMDCDGLLEAHRHYGDSCLKRGGTGLFMMFARKWDRLENQVSNHSYDLFAAYDADKRKEGLLDDIRDLRRYLMIAEAHLMATREGDFSELDKGVEVKNDKAPSSQGFQYPPPEDTRPKTPPEGEGEEAGPGYVNQDRGAASRKKTAESVRADKYRGRFGKIREKVRHLGRDITIQHWREINPMKDKIGKVDGTITEVNTLKDGAFYRFLKMEIRKDETARLYWTSKRNAPGFILEIQNALSESPDIDVTIQKNLFPKG